MAKLRDRVAKLETDVAELTTVTRQQALQISLLQLDLDTTKKVSKEHREALYPSFRRGFPNGTELELLWRKVEEL